MGSRRLCPTVAGMLVGLALVSPALAQKQGGILRVFHRDSPGSMSILEEGSISAIMPMMGVFNNLVLFDQHVPQNRVQSIVPDLATSWSSNEEGTELTFTLREGVRWYDGKPFTAADVKCTYDLLAEKAKEKLRLNYREAWFLNLDEVATNGDNEVSFHLKRPQPAFISLLASGYSPIYPCHVSPRDMRTDGQSPRQPRPAIRQPGAVPGHAAQLGPQVLHRYPRRRAIRCRRGAAAAAGGAFGACPGKCWSS